MEKKLDSFLNFLVKKKKLVQPLLGYIDRVQNTLKKRNQTVRLVTLGRVTDIVSSNIFIY